MKFRLWHRCVLPARQAGQVPSQSRGMTVTASPNCQPCTPSPRARMRPEHPVSKDDGSGDAPIHVAVEDVQVGTADAGESWFDQDLARAGEEDLSLLRDDLSFTGIQRSTSHSRASTGVRIAIDCRCGDRDRTPFAMPPPAHLRRVLDHCRAGRAATSPRSRAEERAQVRRVRAVLKVRLAREAVEAGRRDGWTDLRGDIERMRAAATAGVLAAFAMATRVSTAGSSTSEATRTFSWPGTCSSRASPVCR